MTLAKYREKRRFTETPEPKGKPSEGAGRLRFVVQMHDASQLHYDFRLEVDGVLKSWAIPKGPSLNPVDRRLAVMVEDHPLDYRSFEGIIPEGNYGAGSVIVWDEGFYEAIGAADRRQSLTAMRQGLTKGHLKFVLHGQKLQGEFSLVRLPRGGEKNWLLIKKRDGFASTEDITESNRSVMSDRTLAEIEGAKPARRKPAPLRKRSSRPSAKRSASTEMPTNIEPMLATLVQEPFHRQGWLFEPKWDGYRAIAEVKGGDVRLYSRSHKPFLGGFPPIVKALEQLGHDAVLDGEIVALDAQGRSRFQLLQNYQKTGQGDLTYFVFDLLYLDGRDLRSLPLLERKHLLAQIVDTSSLVRFSEHVEEDGVGFFQAAKEYDLEGIIAKNGSSPYREGSRSLDWLKIKTHRRQEAVIGGFTEPKGRRKGLGALVLGVYENDNLVYIGHTGGGFDAAGLADMRARLTPLIRRQCPFQVEPATNAPAHWVQPKLVCEVEFQEWTEDGRMRQPIFVGLREDKPAKEVRREAEKPIPAIPALVKEPKEALSAPKVKSSTKKSTARSPVPTKRSRTKPTATTKISRAEVTHPDRVYWPDDGYTKRDLIDYYREVAPILLPHLRDRPLSLHRHPQGIQGQSFYQKDVGRQHLPDWVETLKISLESEPKEITSVLCQNEETLVYLANLGCIELNPWLSRRESLDRPDYLVIDLDPDDLPFDKVIAAALTVHRILDQVDAPSICKTSGKRGLHIAVPLGAAYDFDVARQFAEVIARMVQAQLPDTTSVLRRPALRKKRVYLDYLQNRIGQTLAAPYSVRPWPKATVSTPLRWPEVKRGLDPSRFTIQTVPRRLQAFGDLWAPILGSGIDLADCLERLHGTSLLKE